MRFSLFVFKNVLRRPARSLLTMTGMAMAVGAFVTLVGISQGFVHSSLKLYQRHGIDVIVSGSSVDRLNSTIDERLGDKIARLPEVAAVSGALLDVVSFEKAGLYAVLVRGWQPDSFWFDDTHVVDGRRLFADDQGKRQLMLGSVLAKSLHKRVGDQISVFEEDFRVAGIFDALNVIEDGSLIMLLGDLQQLMGRQKTVTGFSVKLKPEYAGDSGIVEQARAKINALDGQGKLRAMATAEFINSTSQIQIANAMAFLTSAVAVGIGIVGILNTMLMSVFERTQEIGILRAIGWRPWRVVGMILNESLLLSAGGAAVGTVGAIVATRLLTTLPAVAGLVQGEVTVAIVLAGIGIALAAGLIGAAYPAYRGARLVPTHALRHE